MDKQKYDRIKNIDIYIFITLGNLINLISVVFFFNDVINSVTNKINYITSETILNVLSLFSIVSMIIAFIGIKKEKKYGPIAGIITGIIYIIESFPLLVVIGIIMIYDCFQINKYKKLNANIDKNYIKTEAVNDSKNSLNKEECCEQIENKAHQKLIISITLITLVFAFIGKITTIGWATVVLTMLLILPIHAILFIVSGLTFANKKNKTKFEYILFIIMCISEILYTYTFVDFGDYGSPVQLIRFLEPKTSKTISFSFFIISLLTAIILNLLNKNFGDTLKKHNDFK